MKKKTRKIGQIAASESFSQRTEIIGNLLYTHPDFRKACFEPRKSFFHCTKRPIIHYEKAFSALQNRLFRSAKRYIQHRRERQTVIC